MFWSQYLWNKSLLVKKAPDICFAKEPKFFSLGTQTRHALILMNDMSYSPLVYTRSCQLIWNNHTGMTTIILVWYLQIWQKIITAKCAGKSESHSGPHFFSFGHNHSTCCRIDIIRAERKRCFHHRADSTPLTSSDVGSCEEEETLQRFRLNWNLKKSYFRKQYLLFQFKLMANLDHGRASNMDNWFAARKMIDSFSRFAQPEIGIPIIKIRQ